MKQVIGQRPLARLLFDPVAQFFLRGIVEPSEPQIGQDIFAMCQDSRFSIWRLDGQGWWQVQLAIEVIDNSER